MCPTSIGHSERSFSPILEHWEYQGWDRQMLRQWTAVPIGTSNLDEPSLAGLGARGVTPHSLPPTVYHLKPLSAAHNMVQGHTAAAILVHHCCLHCRETHLLQLGHLDKGLCGAAEQELTTHQRHFVQLMPPAHCCLWAASAPGHSGVGLKLYSMATSHQGEHNPDTCHTGQPSSTPSGHPHGYWTGA